MHKKLFPFKLSDRGRQQKKLTAKNIIILFATVFFYIFVGIFSSHLFKF